MFKIINIIFKPLISAHNKLMCYIYAGILELAFFLQFVNNLTLSGTGLVNTSIVLSSTISFLIYTGLLITSLVAIIKSNKKLFSISFAVLSILFFVMEFINATNNGLFNVNDGAFIACAVFGLLFYLCLFIFFLLMGLSITYDLRLVILARGFLLLGELFGFIYWILSIVAAAKIQGLLWAMYINPLLIMGGVLFFPTALIYFGFDSLDDTNKVIIEDVKEDEDTKIEAKPKRKKPEPKDKPIDPEVLEGDELK